MTMYAKSLGNGSYKLISEEELFTGYTNYYNKTKKNHKRPITMDEWLECTK